MVAVSGGMFCLVYGFSNAATHGWHTPSTWGFLAAGVALLIVFAAWQSRAAQPLLPPRVVLDRNRGGAYLTMLIIGAGMFGIFLFLIYYMQLTLGYSAVNSGVALLPMVVVIGVMANVGNIVLMPRFGPKPLVIAGLLCNAAGMAWLTRIGVHSGYASALLGPLVVTGIGMGLIFSGGGQHRYLRRGTARRGDSLGERQHRAAARRLDRHRAAQHDRGQRHHQLPGRPPARAASTAAGPARADPRLHHGVLVVRRHLRGRRRRSAARCCAPAR